jgi:hypothetical protein
MLYMLGIGAVVSVGIVAVALLVYFTFDWKYDTAYRAGYKQGHIDGRKIGPVPQNWLPDELREEIPAGWHDERARFLSSRTPKGAMTREDDASQTRPWNS